MKFPLLNIDGSKADSIEISDKLVKLKVNHKLIKFVIDWQLNHAKPRTAKTKQRNEIKGSTKKIVPQKGGGGARHASKKAPLFVGGGVAHGPKGAAYKIKKINKKVRKLALAQTLSKKNSDKNLYILADVKKEIKKTKEFNKFLIKNKLDNVLIISDTDSMKNINKSARNIKNVKLIKEEGTNIYDLFKYKECNITSSSAKKIQERVLNEKINYIDSIRNPIITEKATILSEQNKTVFKVHEKANKKTIKKNIEKLFKVNVIKVNIINQKSKFKMKQGKKSVKSGYKKAIITLKKRSKY